MRSRSRIIPIMILAIALAAIMFVIYTNFSAPDTADPAPSRITAEPGIVTEVIEPDTPDRVNIERKDDADPLAIGALDAPVTIVIFSDFQCAFCALWTHETLPEILPYVDDGRVRIEWRDIAVFGPDSERAAYAAYAAALQGRYLDFSGALFDGGSAPAPSQLSDESLVALAGQLGLDVEKFNSDRFSEEVDEIMQKTFAEGAEHGVFSTPRFLINGRPIVGAQPTHVFLGAIEEESHG